MPAQYRPSDQPRFTLPMAPAPAATLPPATSTTPYATSGASSMPRAVVPSYYDSPRDRSPLRGSGRLTSVTKFMDDVHGLA